MQEGGSEGMCWETHWLLRYMELVLRLCPQLMIWPFLEKKSLLLEPLD